MDLPVFVFSEDDCVPFPGTQMLLDLPLERAKLLKSASLREAATGKYSDQIAIGFSVRDPRVVMSSIDEYSTSVHEIGILCRVDEREECDDFELIHLTGIERIYLHDFRIMESPSTDQSIILTTHQPVSEDFLEAEEALIHDMENLFNLITENPKIYPALLIADIQATQSLISKMNKLADYLLGSPQERIKYLLEDDNYVRWDSIVTLTVAMAAKRPKMSGKKKKPVIKKQPAKEITVPEQALQLPLDEDSMRNIKREVNKLENLAKSSTEYAMVMDYLDWVVSVPWKNTSYKDFDLSKLRETLDETHYGLDEVKAHILEHLVVERLRGGNTGTVLCFVGSPGTGKTSIAQQIAKATHRPLQRIALGGLSDEAEIRGHRRTYVASKPGRFITGLKTAKAMDPLFLLDEVDKIAKFKGDPMTALLEVLDPEQNHSFVDRYLEVPVNLSQAMFICTANNKADIDPALLDRMELIEFRDYTLEERTHITTNYLMPKVLSFYKLESFNIVFDPTLIDVLCKNSIQIRQIEKDIAKLLRMAAVKIHVHGSERVIIDSDFSDQVLNKYKSKNKPIGFGGR